MIVARTLAYERMRRVARTGTELLPLGPHAVEYLLRRMMPAINNHTNVGIVKRLDPNMTCGMDKISAKLIPMVAPGICRSLAYLFNASMRTRKVP